MSFLTSLQNFISETEADVVTIVTNIKAGVAVVESDLAAAEHWIASNAPAIAADIQQVLGLVEAVGIGANPEVAAAVTAANLAVNALNAFAASSNAGATPAQAVVAGYVAVKQAQSAVSSAMASSAAAPTTSAPTATAAVGLLSQPA
jgi:hypothetical protein